jgi:hypothetical protein
MAGARAFSRLLGEAAAVLREFLHNGVKVGGAMALPIFIVAAARRLRSLDRGPKRPPKSAPPKKSGKRGKRAH